MTTPKAAGCDGTSAVGESRTGNPRRIRWSTDRSLLSAGLVSIHFAKLQARRRDQAAQRMLRKVASVPRDAVKVAIRNSPRQGVLGLQVKASDSVAPRETRRLSTAKPAGRSVIRITSISICSAILLIEGSALANNRGGHHRAAATFNLMRNSCRLVH